MKLKLPKTDRILGISAMIISLVTLIIFIYQTEIINQLSKLAVKPHLSFQLLQIGNDSIITFTQTLKNKGLGPAIIQDASILFRNQEYSLFADLFFNEVFPELDKYASLVSSTGVDHRAVVSPDETLVIYRIDVPVTKVSELLEYFEIDENDVNGAPKWNFEIRFTSMYEAEQWLVDDSKNFPKPL